MRLERQNTELEELDLRMQEKMGTRTQVKSWPSDSSSFLTKREVAHMDIDVGRIIGIEAGQ